MKKIDGGICASSGFLAAGIHAGIKKDPAAKDLALIYCTKKCKTAALFTTNSVKAAPIWVSRNNLSDNSAQAIIVNSGNANACTRNGMEVAEMMTIHTAVALGITHRDVVVASTGVIGQELSICSKQYSKLAKALSENGSDAAVEAIMTTDTFAKQAAVEFELGGKTCRIGGIAKGSGMINPNMATLLVFITTDVAISSRLLEKSLREINADTFNMVSVDGDTSTNDMVCIMASGLAGQVKCAYDYEQFANALHTVMEQLAKDIARDGEGATKLIECEVMRARSESTARAVAKSVIGSSLVKAAIGAADANWGRILCAAGYSGAAQLNMNQIAVAFASKAGKITVCRKGAGVPFSEEEATRILSEKDVRILIDLYTGTHSARAWGCDLTAEYVKINAEYRS
jgi:glutamate N-acetyltransferase/amino-acid N-acetyltransferase